ncbi:hypothetical protein DPEC_G00182060 [Dallia pectoralis]|uniref:Uncharacterized protein n=1 Tax=Dallia pectoralis TaxID=75939 RepID=A0ACC2GAL6_DALPE|nr:hypothetical protein DPEC_G00182060 [Dallia pectoralis]
METGNMLKGFQTQFASVMETVLKTAVTETTKLFETTIEELRGEISRIKDENDGLKSKLLSLENEKKSRRESESQTAEPGRSSITTRNIGVQCVLTAQSLPLDVEQRRHPEDKGTADGNPQMAFILIKQEVDWEADYSDEYSPGYILLKQEGGEPPTLVRRQPLREIPTRAVVPPRAAGARIDRYTQDTPTGARPAPATATALLRARRDSLEVRKSLSPSRLGETAISRASQNQASEAREQALEVPPVGPATPSPQLPACHHEPPTSQSTSALVTVQTATGPRHTVTDQSTASGCSSSVLSGLASAALQDPQPIPVPPRPPRPPRPPPPAQSDVDVLPVAPTIPPTRPPTVSDLSVVVTATPPGSSTRSPTERQPPSITEDVHWQPEKSAEVPGETSPEGALGQMSGPAEATPPAVSHMSKAPLSVASLVCTPPSVGEEDGEEKLSPRPTVTPETAVTRSVATETSPADEKQVVGVGCGGVLKRRRREAILAGLRRRLKPRLSGGTSTPAVAEMSSSDETPALKNDDTHVTKNGEDTSSCSRSGYENGDLMNTAPDSMTDGDHSRPDSSNQAASEEEDRGADDNVARQSPICEERGVSKSRKRSMTWVQAQRGLALAQAKRSRSKVTKASQRGLRSELRGLVTQAQFLASTRQRRRSHSSSPHTASSMRRTSPRQPTGPSVCPSPATPPHPQPEFLKEPSTTPRPLKDPSVTPRRGRPRSSTAAVLNLTRIPSVSQQIPFTGGLRTGFKMSPQSPLIQQAWRCRQSQPVWTPPGPFQLQQSPQSPQQCMAKNLCTDCGRVLSSPAALLSHAALHRGERPFACSTCGKDFPDLKGLTRHSHVHVDVTQRGHQCPQCGKTFVYRFGLTKHQQVVHSGIRPYVCQICDKGFVIRRDLEIHLRVHTGEKPFACSLCVKRFKRRVELNVHIKWHNGEKRHWCAYCGKGFLDYNNLKRHKLVHTGEKPFTCSECGKCFKQTGHLKKHLKNVHKVR